MKAILHGVGKLALVVCINVFFIPVMSLALLALFENDPHFQMPFFAFMAVLLVVLLECVIVWSRNPENRMKRMLNGMAQAVTMVPLAVAILGGVSYFDQGYRLLTDGENVLRQLVRLLFIAALALIPPVSIGWQHVRRRRTAVQ